MSAPWLVLMRSDGIVVEVRGGAPARWVGMRLDDGGSEAPAPLIEAARGLLAAASRGEGGSWLERAFVPSPTPGAPDVELLLIEAVPLRKSRVAVLELLGRTNDALFEQAKATRVSLRMHAGRAMPPSCPIDAEKIAWGLASLVGSALRHVSRSSREEREVEVSADYDPDARELVLKVYDNGPGIPPEKLRWLFDRDPQTQQSAGLALLMLHDVVLAHGGRMNVASDTGVAHGTTVTIRLPVGGASGSEG